MSQAAELLNSLTDQQIAAYSAGSGKTEEHIVIGDNRFTTVPNSLKRLAVQYDHNVETVTFDCPRYWDGIDMSKMAIYINYMLPNGTLGAFLAENVSVDANDSNTMHFTWTIKSNVTVTPGTISFLVCIKKTDSEGIEENHWNSELNTECYISKGMETVESVVSEHPDIITQLLLRMDAVEAVQDIAVNAAAEATAKAEEASGYSDETAALLEETKIHAKTAQDAAADTLNIHGRIDRNDKRLSVLEQGLANYIPSETDADIAYLKNVPENALPYMSINEIGGTTRKCANLIPFPYTSGPGMTGKGITWTTNSNGTITASGAFESADVVQFILSKNFPFEHGVTYTISDAMVIYSIGDNPKLYYFNNARTTNGVTSSFTWDTSYKLNRIQLQITYNVYDGNSITFYPMLNKGDTALPYEPYFEGLRDAKVTEIESVGANLIPFPYNYQSKTGSGVTWIAQEDGGIAVSGTPTDYTIFELCDRLDISDVDSFMITMYGTYSNLVVDGHIDDKSGKILVSNIVADRCYKKSDYPTAAYLSVGVKRKATGTPCTGVVYIMINKGDTALPYSPYVKRTFPIPEAVQALDGYGQGVNKQYYNKLVLNPASGVKKFEQTVKKVVLSGDEDWVQNNGWGYSDNYFAVRLDKNEIGRGLQLYTISAPWTRSVNDRSDYTTVTNYGWFTFNISSITSVSDWKAYVQANPIEIVLVFSTPIETDVSAYFTDDNLIGVEAGGTVTAVNEYNYDVPTNLTYWLKKTS